MLKLIVVDRSAESRSRLAEQLINFLNDAAVDSEVLPRIDLKPISIQELKYQSAPDFCIIGEELSSCGPAEVARIQKLCPAATLIAKLAPHKASLATVELLARAGVSDFLLPTISAAEFLNKLLIHSRKQNRRHQGKLVLVESGKGGLGVTSICAAVGDALLERGYRVVLVDLDFETQDLSRFLGARPYLNENLQDLTDGQRPVTEEFVLQCLTTLWQDEERIKIMPPTLEREDLFAGSGSAVRIYNAVFQVLTDLFDYVVVDSGSMRGALARMLYRQMNFCLFLANNDPAALFGSLSKVEHILPLANPESNFLLLENNHRREGLPINFVQREFQRLFPQPDREPYNLPIPHSQDGYAWPGSGSTLRTLGGAALARAIDGVVDTIGAASGHQTPTVECCHNQIQLQTFFSGMIQRLQTAARAVTALSCSLARPALPPLKTALALPCSAAAALQEPSAPAPPIPEKDKTSPQSLLSGISYS